MPKSPARPVLPRLVRCPVCGHKDFFAVYTATLRVSHLQQEPNGRWRHRSTDPKAFETSLPMLLVCESCAQPLGQPPQELLKALPKHPNRRSN